MSDIAIIVSNHSSICKAEILSKTLGLPIIDAVDICNYNFVLVITDRRLELKKTKSKEKSVFVDFYSKSLIYRCKYGGGNRQLIAKAVGVKKNSSLKIIDATAGLGVDSFILSSLGCDVLMLERSPVIGALLADGLNRAALKADFKKLCLNLKIVDSIDYLKTIAIDGKELPDVIYLDPMYPGDRNALNKKSMRFLRQIVGKDEDVGELFNISLKCAKKRVVVKRHKSAPSINNFEATIKFLGKSSRYDVYLT